jgi:hypothetical protein
MKPDARLQIQALHTLYQDLTGQPIRLAYDRERLWFEWLRAGYSATDLKEVVAYLQKEIRYQRRNVGALKLSNLLQPDRFEEDRAISSVRLHPRPHTSNPSPQTPTPPPDPRKRQQALVFLRDLKNQIR